MVFERSEDYLCYVEAVHLLYYENHKKECLFLNNTDNDFFSAITKKSFEQDEFLTKNDRAREYFFVIDNTEYPEALSNPNWKKPSKSKSNPNNLYINVEFEILYTSNDKFKFWTTMFSIVFSILGLLTLTSFIYFLV